MVKRSNIQCRKCYRMLGSLTSKNKGICFKCEKGTFAYTYNLPFTKAKHDKLKRKSKRFKQKVLKILQNNTLTNTEIFKRQNIYTSRRTIYRRMNELHKQDKVLQLKNKVGVVMWTIKK